MQLRADNRVGAGEGWAPAPACWGCFLQRPDEPVNYPAAVGGSRSFFLSNKPSQEAGLELQGPQLWLGLTPGFFIHGFLPKTVGGALRAPQSGQCTLQGNGVRSLHMGRWREGWGSPVIYGRGSVGWV